ncbi:calcium-binding protein [Rhodoferax lacus]|uniref:Calcium-binding protein n=1 Tax=Rhodoferax lacus TaxID=2184758 RepID=A0A3E1RBR3_9BURK|nr:excalibur calcium-binding domain-containing protein [Rhodoferax lacus]RFO96796.1 calcium-binding protein [Rhodoferax lacus]
MLKSFALALVLAPFLLASTAVAATQIYKCNVNGSVRYQQDPCPSNEVRKQPTVEELNAERQKQLAKDKELPARAKFQAPPLAATEALNEMPTKASASPMPSFQCDGRKYCSQMTSCAEAKYFLAHCPGVKMDGDADGIPCEEQWCAP